MHLGDVSWTDNCYNLHRCTVTSVGPTTVVSLYLHSEHIHTHTLIAMYGACELICDTLHTYHQGVVQKTLKQARTMLWENMTWGILGSYDDSNFLSYIRDIHTMCVLMGEPLCAREWDKVLLFRSSIVPSYGLDGFGIMLNNVNSWTILRNMKQNPIDENTMIDFHAFMHNNTRFGDECTVKMARKYPQFAKDTIMINPYGGYWLKSYPGLVILKDARVKRKGVYYGGHTDPVTPISPYEYACAHSSSKVARLCE